MPDLNYNITSQADTDGADVEDGRSEPFMGANDGAAYPHKGTDEQRPEPGPAAYQDFTVPDGVTADPALLDEFKGLAGKMGLTQKQAQQLVDLQTKTGKAQLEQYAQTRQAWLEEIYTDRNFGGGNIGQTVQECELALQEYDPDKKLRKLMLDSGFKDNPDVLRFLARIGRAKHKEGRVLTSRGRWQAEEKPLTDRLWPYMK